MKNVQYPEIDFSKYRALLVDLDDTLYDYNYFHNLTIKHCYDSFDWGFSDFESWEKAYRNKRNEITHRLNFSGSCRSRLFAFQEMAEEKSMEKAYIIGHKMELTYWNYFLNIIKPFPQAITFLSNAKSNKLKICMVTDMQHHFQVQKIQALKIEPYIDYLVSSDLVGIEKPDAKIFEAAVKRINIPLENILMIGDSLEKDIKGARDFGINAFQI